jgi:chaperone required for assembly of F1-ATPase
LAEAIADEWNAQVKRVDPTTMPLTQMTCTTINDDSGSCVGSIALMNSRSRNSP